MDDDTLMGLPVHVDPFCPPNTVYLIDPGAIVRIPISQQAIDLMSTGEPDLSWRAADINHAVLWRWLTDPEYHALVTAWSMESGVPIEDLLDQHSENLPYIRNGLPEQYRSMRSSKPLSLAMVDEMMRDIPQLRPACPNH